MNKTSKVARYLLGLLFLVFGGAGLFNLMPPPPDMPQEVLNFMNAMVATGYFFPFLKGTEMICGLLLLIGIAPALMLVILAPIVIHIFLFHLFLTPGISNLVMPIIIITLLLLSAWQYCSVYQPLFKRG